MKKIFILFCTIISFSCYSKDIRTPPCYSPNNWATQTALAAMQHSGMFPDDGFSIADKNGKFFHLKTKLLDSKNLGKGDKSDPTEDVYRQVQKIDLKTKEGKYFEVLTISKSSFSECSIEMVGVIILSPEFKVLDIEG